MASQTKYILHGGLTRADNELNRSFYEELVRDVPDGGTVLLVYFAVRQDDTSQMYKGQSRQISAQAHGKALHFVEATKEQFLEQLAHAHAVYFQGGSTPKLLEALRTYPDLAMHFEGKTVAGSSAGAYALAAYGTAHHDGGVREGLGILPLRVICHYESTELPPSEGSVHELESIAPELELVVLRDCEWKVVGT